MLDTNLCQRHSLSVVELIKAYKMQFDVLNRIMGKKSKTQPDEVLNNPSTSVEPLPITSEVEYDDLPDISVSFDRETIRRTLGKVGDDMVREYLNYCLQQEDVFENWLKIFNKQS